MAHARGVSHRTSTGWLLWLLEMMMIRRFSVRPHPPLLGADRDLQRDGPGDELHFYRMQGAVSGACAILASCVGPSKAWRVISRWVNLPVITDRACAWCSRQPGVIYVTRDSYDEAVVRSNGYHGGPRHADFPGHRVEPLEPESEEENDRGASQEEPDAYTGIAETPMKRRRFAPGRWVRPSGHRRGRQSG